MESGTKLGHYEISTLLGKGGMGEVWRARDTKLGREVAIKTLPEEFAKDADRLARFEREARLLASLNHPSIAAIHGFEEDNGTHFLVLELVEGDTLADKIKRGAIPVEESLTLALQIAEALEAAHEKGVFHRDLKPLNIKVTPEGKVKVLDFGLAKAFEGDAGADLSQSPTLSMAATQQGVMFGTAAYMSPEQARGETADKRVDVWAFGCVLFEMLTGRKTFKGRGVSDVLASVLKIDPDWNSLPLNLHPRIRMLLERCLEKEVKDRYQASGDARVDVQQVLADPAGVLIQPVAEVAQAARQSKLPWVGVGAFVSAVALGLVAWTLWPQPASLRISRTTITTPDDQPLLLGTQSPVVTLSPDGTIVIYRVSNDEQQVMVVRPLDSLDATVLHESASTGIAPFFSPDGAWVGFNDQADDTIKRVAITGGPALTISEVGAPRMAGADWGEDDTIVFARTDSSGLWQVPVGGGTREPLTTLSEDQGESNHEWPQLLPGEEAVLFTIRYANQRADSIAVRHLETEEQKVLVSGGSYARYVPTGHLVYGFEGTLRAVPFDLETLEVKGVPVGVLDGILTRSVTGSAEFEIANDGSLLYVYVEDTDFDTVEGVLALVDRDGGIERLNVPPANYVSPRVSPDGTQVAVASIDDDEERRIWVYDLSGDTSIRQLTFDGNNALPIWTPDGEWITFRSDRDAEDRDTEQADTASIYRTRADGSGVPERLTTAEDGELQFPDSYSSDGRLSFNSNVSGTNGIWTLSGEDGAEPEVFIDLPESFQFGSVFSPDGNWIAYNSSESGTVEIYVQPFPPTGAKSQITQTGGTRPLWSPDGSQLFFFSPNSSQLNVVDIETTPAVTFGSPQPIPIGAGGNAGDFDIMPDGERLVVIVPVAEGELQDNEAPRPQINIVLNWFEELKERVPVP